MAPAHLIPSPQDEVRTLRGKVAIVTGASRGLGRAFVDALVEHGAVVACLARPSAELDELARHHGDAVAPFPCDVSDASQIDRAVAGAVERFGRLDVLVNNAAIFHPFLVEEATAAQVEAHIGVNLFGPIWLARAAIPHLRATKGQVVSISSESVRMPFPFLTVYAATKAALEVLSAGLRDELRADGIRVTVLRSGSLKGGSGDRDWDPEVARRFFETIQTTGHAAFTGDAVEAASMAQTLVAILGLPRDVNLDMVEARGAGTLLPTSPANGRN